MDQDKALSILENQISTLKNMKKNDSKAARKEIKLTFQELMNEKAVKLKELEQECEDLNYLIKTLEKEQADVEEYLQRESIMIAQLQKIDNEKAQKKKMLSSCKVQYHDRLVKASSKPSTKDVQRIETYKKKLAAYKKITGVIWDYPSCNSNSLCGYIRTSDKLKIFNLDISGLSREEIVKAMWKTLEHAPR